MKAPSSGAAAAVAAAPNACEGQLYASLSESIPGGSVMRILCCFSPLRFLRSDFVGLPCLSIKAEVSFCLDF